MTGEETQELYANMYPTYFVVERQELTKLHSNKNQRVAIFALNTTEQGILK